MRFSRTFRTNRPVARHGSRSWRRLETARAGCRFAAVSNGDDGCAVTVYDTDTRVVRDAPGAECVRVRDGRIVWMRIIVDRLPFREAAAEKESGRRLAYPVVHGITEPPLPHSDQRVDRQHYQSDPHDSEPD